MTQTAAVLFGIFGGTVSGLSVGLFMGYCLCQGSHRREQKARRSEVTP